MGYDPFGRGTDEFPQVSSLTDSIYWTVVADIISRAWDIASNGTVYHLQSDGQSKRTN